MILVLVTVVLVLIFDLLTKHWAAEVLAPGGEIAFIPGVVNLKYNENPGAAFGMLGNHRWVFMVLSVAGLALIAVLLLKARPKSPWIRLTAGLVLGGGIGNMIDRLGFGFAAFEKGCVVDFIDCSPIRFPWIFNVADACVTVGCFLYVILTLVSEFREAGKERAADGPGEDSGDEDGSQSEKTDAEKSGCATAEDEPADGENAESGEAHESRGEVMNREDDADA